MADPLYVLLVSGTPEGEDDGFARCAWLRVGDLVKQFFRDRDKTGAPVKADTVLRFIHLDCHAEVVGIYEHDFAVAKGKVPALLGEIHRRELTRNWVVLDAGFKTAHGSLDVQHDPKTFVPWKEIADKKKKAEDDAAKDPKKKPNLHQAVSIVDAYHCARRAPRGSILELSIFGHAFADGPVLNNTNAVEGSNRRSPDDTDGRADIDFQQDMGEDGAANKNALTDFRNAFADTGSFRIWGCNIQDVVKTMPPPNPKDPTDVVVRRCLIMSTVRQVVEAAFTYPMMRKTAIGDLERASKVPAGSTKIELDMDGEFAEEVRLQKDRGAGHGLTPFTRDRLFEIRYNEVFPNHKYQDFFRGEKRNGKPAKSITRTLSEIVKFVAVETTPTYFFKAAQALQTVAPGPTVQTVAVFSPPPGASAELDSSGQQFVSKGRMDQVKFFTKFFGVETTEPGTVREGHYAVWDRKGKAVQAVLNRAANGLP
jgi:hypothetical protein